MFNLFKKSIPPTPTPTHCECHGDLERLQELYTQLGIKEKEKEDFIKNSVFKYNVGSFNFYNYFDKYDSTNLELYKIDLDKILADTWKYDYRYERYETIWAKERLGIATVLDFLYNVYQNNYDNKLKNAFIEVNDYFINRIPKYSVSFLRDMSKLTSDLADFLENEENRKAKVIQYDEEIKQIKKEIEEIKERLHIQ